MREPHQILGVAKNADATTIKQAYRRLAKQYHPDAAGQDTESHKRFQEVTDAYRALRALSASEERIAASAAEATRAYEQPRAELEPEEIRRGPSPTNAKPTRAGGPDAAGEKGARRAAEFFETLKQAGTRPFRRRGDDLACSLDVPFIDAAKGGTHRVTLPNGRTVDVTLPAGIADGQQIRLRGLGIEGSAGGGAGDAIVTVDIEPHPFFSREGHDIRLALPISIAEAVDGAKVQVPTISGRVWVTIPAGSNSGTVLRLAGKGLDRGDGESGHQFIELIVMLPDSPDTDLADFVRRWPAAKSFDPRAAVGLS